MTYLESFCVFFSKHNSKILNQHFLSFLIFRISHVSISPTPQTKDDKWGTTDLQCGLPPFWVSRIVFFQSGQFGIVFRGFSHQKISPKPKSKRSGHDGARNAIFSFFWGKVSWWRWINQIHNIWHFWFLQINKVFWWLGLLFVQVTSAFVCRVYI